MSALSPPVLQSANTPPKDSSANTSQTCRLCTWFGCLVSTNNGTQWAGVGPEGGRAAGTETVTGMQTEKSDTDEGGGGVQFQPPLKDAASR